jgi:hypothetical protein
MRPRNPARRRSIGGIAPTFGSSLPAKGHGSRAHADHCSAEATPGAQAACLAMEKASSLSNMIKERDLI